MGKTFRILVETIGIPQLLAFVIGVPAMIGFILTLWNNLNTNQRIIVIVLAIAIIIAIVLFIYGQSRKILYIIPTILLGMHYRMIELANNFDNTALSISALEYLFKSLGIQTEVDKYITQLKQANNEQELIDIIQTEIYPIMQILEPKMRQAIQLNKLIPVNISKYISDNTGLEQLLNTDKVYQQKLNRLQKIKPLIPTERISNAVIVYTRASEILNKSAIALHMNEYMKHIMPMPKLIEIKVMSDEVQDNMDNLLAKVREAIDEYYRK